jgi:hypothetical protein
MQCDQKGILHGPFAPARAHLLSMSQAMYKRRGAKHIWVLVHQYQFPDSYEPRLPVTQFDPARSGVQSTMATKHPGRPRRYCVAVTPSRCSATVELCNR